ncbi:MAG: glycolate oxidase [Candidatus Magnetoglobus multicellularis str. Araruama]|uniref:Glycolate oxidase n=1 Tax=Candidatus Magnetoglobus multicellularis str. Araruama TaxID=890399 RepID=A0A1V1P5V8_9BACT|nr:MAG: glycolate oxidase [Candidatus Magnetoglobus multicellularis str. Araruama]
MKQQKLPSLSKGTINQLKSITGKVLTAEADLRCYAYDATNMQYMPDAIIFPENEAQISQILSLANDVEFSVVPRGSGSGLTGGALPVQGGLVVVMTRMNQVIDIDMDNLIADVQPGVVTGIFHQRVHNLGLFYPPDPSSSAYSTLGGNVAECAGGPSAVKYGVTRDYVLGLNAVIPGGSIIRTGVRTAKGVVGYDLTRLLTGSEGTLGIITQMTLKLLPKPECTQTLTVFYPSMHQAAENVSEIIRQGLIPKTIEYLDHAAIACLPANFPGKIPSAAKAMLIIEIDGIPDQVNTECLQIMNLVEQFQAISVSKAENPAQSHAIWQARKAISPALYKYAPDKINEDIVVPRSRIPEFVDKVDELRHATGLTMITFGHAGDGNIHFTLMLDRNDTDAQKKADIVIESVFDYTLSLGGTLSGEHGIGISKASYLEKEIDPPTLALMRQVKKAFDPKGILNPGKIFPGDS